MALYILGNLTLFDQQKQQISSTALRESLRKSFLKTTVVDNIVELTWFFYKPAGLKMHTISYSIALIKNEAK